MDELSQETEVHKLPDGWNETLDPHRFWVRWKDNVMVFSVNDGVIDTGSHEFMTADTFRCALIARFGPATYSERKPTP